MDVSSWERVSDLVKARLCLPLWIPWGIYQYSSDRSAAERPRHAVFWLKSESIDIATFPDGGAYSPPNT